MSQSEFENNPFWALIDSANEAIKDFLPLTDLEEFAISRSIVVLDFLQTRRSIPEFLLSSQWRLQIERLSSSVARIESLFRTWKSSGSTPAGLQELTNNLDAILEVLRQWPTVEDNKRRNAAFAGIRAEIEAGRQRLLKTAEVAAEIQEAFDNFTKSQTAISAEADARLQSISALNLKLTTQIDSLTAEVRSQFSDELLRQSTSWQERLLEEREKAEVHLKEIASLSQRAKEIFSLVAGDSISNDYQKHALSEAKAAKTWYIIGFSIFGVGLTILTVYVTLWAEQDMNRIEFFLAKITLSLSALGVATFAFREAGKRKRNEQIAKYRAMDSVALTPYLNLLKDPVRSIVETKLGLRLASDPSFAPKDDPDPTDHLTQFFMDQRANKDLGGAAG